MDGKGFIGNPAGRSKMGMSFGYCAEVEAAGSAGTGR
jgi:hypothetical protein